MAKPCGPEIAAVRENIRKLESKFLLTTWQIDFLKNHKYFKPVQPHGPKAEAGSKIIDGTASNSDGALTKPLSPAGSLLVYDKGEIRVADIFVMPFFFIEQFILHHYSIYYEFY